MQTIEKILWYKPFWKKLEVLRELGLYNGMGNDIYNFDSLLKEIIELVGRKYEYDKNQKLYNDIQELVARHDLDYVLKIGKLKADIRLAYGLWQLLHWIDWKLRLWLCLAVFKALQSKEARNTYNT